MPGVHTFYDGATFLEPIAKHYGVQVDKINFVLCMFSSLFLAFAYRKFMAPGAVSRQIRVLFPPLIGISFCFFCFGRASKHLLANCLINYAIMYFAPPKHVHRLVFTFCMCYLLFIHFYRWLILTSYYLDITGPMMVAVQKITTVAFSLHDGRVKKREELNELQRREAITELPSLAEYVSFIFNFQTALTGPVNFYSDYLAFIDGVHVVRAKNGEEPSPVGASMRKLAESLLYLLIIARFGATYPPEIISYKEYLALPHLQWLMWWFIVIFLIRVNYYFAWTFADSVCNLSGFGFSGYDENGNAKWELCTNVRPYQVEMAQSFKETLDGWNIQTGGWLRRVAYDRTPKKIRTFATYALSAMWHGISVGYYMTFFTGALFTLTGATFRRCMRHRFLDCPKKKFAYDVVTFMATKIALAYATYPFVTMNLNPAFSLYKRVFFIVHITAILILVILPRVYPPPPRTKPSTNTNSSLKADQVTSPEVKKDL